MGYNMRREPFIGPLLENTQMVPLTQGQFALVDEEDFEDLMQFNWCAAWDPECKSFRALRYTSKAEGKQIQVMHQYITGFQWKIVDHINHRTLDNRKDNLRDGTLYNARNRVNKKVGSSQYHGVCWDASHNKWLAQISHNGKRWKLGRFDVEIEAAQAYDAASLEHHGEYGTRNFPNTNTENQV